MRELAVQSANDTNTDDDRAKLELEFQELKKEITRISTDTEFNTKPLLNGEHENKSLKLQVGANSGQAIDVYTGEVSSDSIGIAKSSIATREDADQAMKEMDGALNKVSMERSRLGAYQNLLEHAYNVNMNTAENLTAAESRIRDAYIAQEMMNFVKASILMQASQYVMRLHMQQAQSLLDLLNPRPPKRL